MWHERNPCNRREQLAEDLFLCCVPQRKTKLGKANHAASLLDRALNRTGCLILKLTWTEGRAGLSPRPRLSYCRSMNTCSYDFAMSALCELWPVPISVTHASIGIAPPLMLYIIWYCFMHQILLEIAFASWYHCLIAIHICFLILWECASLEQPYKNRILYSLSH